MQLCIASGQYSPTWAGEAITILWYDSRTAAEHDHTWARTGGTESEDCDPSVPRTGREAAEVAFPAFSSQESGILRSDYPI